MKKTLSLLICLSFLLSSGIKANAQGKVHVIDLADQNQNVFVSDISADGTKISGYDYYQSFSFIWTKESGITILDQGCGGSAANAISNSGIITGQFADSTLMYEDEYYGTLALASAGYFKDGKWHSLGLKEGIPPMNLGGSSSYVITPDGKYIGGSWKATNEDGRDLIEPVIWDISGAEVKARVLEHKAIGQGAKVNSLSADGKVAGGWAAPLNMRNPVIWIDGKIKDITLNGIVSYGEVHDVSPNGRYVALSMEGQAAVYDIKEDRLTMLPMKEGMVSASATNVSNDGFVIGYHQIMVGPTNREAFVYSEGLGVVSLNDYLEKLKVSVPAGLIMETTMGISADGKKLVGFGEAQLSNGLYMVGWYIELDRHLQGLNPARDLSATEEALGEIKVTWQAPSEENASAWLVGYNLYRNGEKVNEEPLSETVYNDKSLEHGTYKYKVTAIWGNSVESRPTQEAKVNTALVELPFYDDFSSANIDSLYWNVSSSTSSWKVSPYAGIQPPSLSYYTPAGAKYEDSITSPWIQAEYANDLYLSFNLLIPYSEYPGNDSLRIDIFNGEEWKAIAYYGSSEWMTYSFEPQTLDISEIAAGKIIRLRFTASGDNKDGYMAWGIDNINIYSSRDKFRVEKPLNLTAYVMEDGNVRMNWTDPNEVASLSYLPGEDVTYSIGNEGKTFIAANLYTPEDLESYDGYYLTHISAYLNQNYWVATPAKYRLVVFKGDRQVISQDITDFTPNAWNTFAIKKTTFIDASTPLYFGIEIVEHDPNDWPIGSCDGVLVDTFDDEQIIVNDGKSNIYSEDGGKTWKKLTADNIKESMAIKATVSKARPGTAKERLMGYRVYRNGYDMLGNDGYGNRLLTPLNNYVDRTPFTDSRDYTVTAFYITQEESDESVPAYIPGKGTPLTRSDVTGNIEVDNNVKIYNLQSNLYVVTSTPGILSIYTAGGNLHSQRNVTAGETVINMPVGVYIVKLGDITQKIVIAN